MALYYCSITGEPAEVPVISKHSGHVYERRIIEKYIDANQTDPITNQPLTRNDIIPLQVNNLTKPRPANASGVGDLITMFQNEWDSLMQETHSLKQNLESVRQELSHALYQHDAACRVIAKLTRERDEARQRIAEFAEDGTRIQDSRMEEELTRDLTSEIIDRIVERQKELSSMRKDKKKNKAVIEKFATTEAIAGYKLAHTVTLHSSTVPGITCLDINQGRDDLIVTGGNDGAVIFYDKNHDRIINTYDKLNKKITDVKFVSKRDVPSNNPLCLISSEDGIGHLLSNNLQTKEITVAYTVDVHKDALVACTTHPLGSLGVFACRDGSFSYHDLAEGRLLSYVSMSGYKLKTLRIHPDGHLAVLGGHDGTLRIWNVLEQSQVAEIKAHTGPVTSLSFSENGINFATSSWDDKTVKLWDLRNLGEENFKVVDENSGGAVNFDQYGQILAVGTSDLTLYNVKDLTEFSRKTDHKDVITSIQFGQYSRYVATVGLDRNMNIYS